MYQLILAMLLSAVLFGQVAPKPASTLNDSENAQKARTLIDQAVQALGGQAYLTAQNKGEEGRLYSLYHGQNGGMGAQYRLFDRFPDKDRLEIIKRGNVVLPLPLVGIIVVGHQVKDKNDMVIIHNGDKGYELTYKGTAALEKDDLAAYLRRRQHSLGHVLRKWVNDPAMGFFYDGLAIVDGKPSDKVTLLNNQNDSVTVFLDQNSHLPLKTGYSWRDPKDRQRNSEEEVYDNYRLVQGIMTPHSITRYFNGEMSHQRFINTASYNTNLPEDLFDASVTYDPKAPPTKK